MQFVKRNDFVDEHHQCPTYTTEELADKPESYFDGHWDGGTHAGKGFGLKVYFFWRPTQNPTELEVLIEEHYSNSVIYCCVSDPLFEMTGLIEWAISEFHLDDILSQIDRK